MYLTLEFGKFQTKKGLKQENLRKIELEFVSISWVINHMTCYNSSALIGWNYKGGFFSESVIELEIKISRQKQ